MFAQDVKRTTHAVAGQASADRKKASRQLVHVGTEEDRDLGISIWHKPEVNTLLRLSKSLCCARH
jgi:hypothetical protein